MSTRLAEAVTADKVIGCAADEVVEDDEDVGAEDEDGTEAAAPEPPPPQAESPSATPANRALMPAVLGCEPELVFITAFLAGPRTCVSLGSGI
jgi:hypothetical protein